MVELQAAIEAPTRFAATDLLHRRAPLLYRFQLALGNANVLIQTDSGLMQRVLCGRERSSGLIAEAVLAVWEIAVEVQIERTVQENEEMADSFDAYCFGPSRSLHMSNGSWFAYTPPSLSGVGFAIVVGDERSQVRQLLTFIESIKMFLGEREAPNDSEVERKVGA